MTKSVLATEVVKTHNASAILDGLDVTVKAEILCYYNASRTVLHMEILMLKVENAIAMHVGQGVNVI